MEARARAGSAVPPPALGAGDCLAAVAPSGIFDRAAFERGISRLGERFKVRYSLNIAEQKGYLAGDDRRRHQELRSALENTNIKAIVAARGGYGSTRLLGMLDVDLIARNPKLLIGFSDVTALHAAWARAGVRSIHGSMAAALGDCEERLFERWVRAVAGAKPEPLTDLSAIAKGRARGPLRGGNLSVLTALIGTPYGPPLSGCVLFLEDTKEQPYRVDRMLTTWRQCGWLSQVSAIVLGAFSKSEAGPDGVTVDEVLRERLEDLGVPVVAGVPAGHIPDNLELPFGAEVTVDADARRLEFHEPAAGA